MKDNLIDTYLGTIHLGRPQFGGGRGQISLKLPTDSSKKLPTEVGRCQKSCKFCGRPKWMVPYKLTNIQETYFFSTGKI